MFAPNHKFDDIVVALLASAVGGDVAPIAKQRAFVGERRDLVHSVRNVEQREPLGAQPLQHREHLGDIGARESGGRLVEDQ